MRMLVIEQLDPLEQDFVSVFSGFRDTLICRSWKTDEYYHRIGKPAVIFQNRVHWYKNGCFVSE